MGHKVIEIDPSEYGIGTAVLNQRHGAGIVRYVYDTPAGPHAIVKFAGSLMRVMPLSLLTLAPAADDSPALPPVV